MKKILRTLGILSIGLTLAACGQSKESSPTEDSEIVNDEISFNAGKHIGKAEGHNGTIEVEVEFSEDEILAIEVLASEETEHLAELVYERIPEEVIEDQTTNVDFVSGATITSGAFKSAIIDAVKKANGNPELLDKESTKELSTETIELESELVVIGGGAAGLSAALKAEQEGLTVILLEQTAMLGGHTALSGAYTLATGAEIQAELGVTDDTPEKAYADIMKNGGDLSIPEILSMYTEEMGESTDWTLDYIGAEAPDKLTPLSENGVDRALIYAGGGPALIQAYADKLEDTTVELYLDTTATSILTDGNDVIGVEAVAKDGTSYTITADTTVLASGSYGARSDMLPDELQDFVYYGASLADGKGLEMGEEVGADTIHMGEVELFENGVEWLPGIAKSTYSGSMAAWEKSGILVDRDGKRVVSEKAPGKMIAKAQAEQEDSTLFLLMDQKTFDYFSDNIAGYGISQEMLADWLEVNGERGPVFANADTLEEVAKIAGVDQESLAATVEKYNTFVENGEDEDFDRNPDYMTEKIEAGPYYLVEQKPRYATTLGGLLVNEKLQVINTSGEVINGLYSAGDTAGGLRGNDSIPGSDVGWAITSGYVIGRDLAK